MNGKQTLPSFLLFPLLSLSNEHRRNYCMFWHQNDGKNCLLSANLSFVAFGLTQGPLGGIFRQAFNSVPVFSNKHTVTDAIFVDNICSVNMRGILAVINTT